MREEVLVREGHVRRRDGGGKRGKKREGWMDRDGKNGEGKK